MKLYGKEYLQWPTQTDVEKLRFPRGNTWVSCLPGMIRSIDCTKWPWAQCPQHLRGQFAKGDSGPDPFILLEAVASQDL